ARTSHRRGSGLSGIHDPLRVQSPALRRGDGGHGALRKGHRGQPVVHHPFAAAAPRRALYHLRARGEGNGRGAEDRAGGPHRQGGDPRVTKAGRGRRPAAAPSLSTPPAPLTHPAVLAAALAAAISVVLSVSFAIFDPDLFQHLLVGKAIWTLH